MADTPAASSTLTVKSYGLSVAFAFGVPEIIPDASVNPVGSAPKETDQVSGVLPPLTGTVNV